MDKNAVKDKIIELRKQISYHNDKYYNQDDPEISDYEYDILMSELKKMEKEHPELITPDSPTQNVGGTVKRESGKLVKHRVPMLSLQNLFTKEEVYQFVKDMQEQLTDPEFLVEKKIDGLSMVLRYENGPLDVAITRGDGVIQGEDVTENAKVIKDVIRKLKNPIPYLEIRGEVYMSRESFIAANNHQEMLGKKTFANARNCAAGTLRQLDPQITKNRDLSFFAFNIQDIQGVEVKTHTDGYEYLKNQGIKVVEDYLVCKTADEVWDAIQKIGEARGDLKYDIDGAVVKINKLSDREILGSTSKVPRWAVAYKFPPEEKETVIRDIRLTVGRTGRITPTAIFDPIHLCGTNVEKATLHNQSRINELDVRINDTVVIRKAGEIIPEVVRVVKEKRPEGAKPFIISNTCPVCGAPAVREDDTADIKCTGANCPAQLERHIINFVGKRAMDIKGFGEVYVEILVRNGFIKNIADVYNLKKYRDELIEKGYIGKEKNTDKLLHLIEKSKSNEAHCVLTGLGIPNIGKTISKTLMKYFGSIDNLMKASFDELKEIQDIGNVSAAAIKSFFNDPSNIQIINELKDHGVNMESVSEEVIDNKLAGLTIVVTGTLSTMGRDEAQALIEKYGGKTSGSVSKKTSYVLAGENAGSKLTKAIKLGLPVISEDDFIKLLKTDQIHSTV